MQCEEGLVYTHLYLIQLCSDRKCITYCLILLGIVDLALLLENRQAHTLALGQGNKGLVSLSNDKHILQPAKDLKS